MEQNLFSNLENHTCLASATAQSIKELGVFSYPTIFRDFRSLKNFLCGEKHRDIRRLKNKL